METPDTAVTVRIPESWLWAIRLAGALLGLCAAFVVGPVVDWLVEVLGGAPGPLRVAARLPLVWAVPVLTVVGGLAGAWVARAWQRETAVVTIAEHAVRIDREGAGRHLDRDRIGMVYSDKGELVVLDVGAEELARAKVDSGLVPRLRDAFERFGYPWRGTADPYEADYATWVDGTPDLDTVDHTLLRTRQRALADKRIGAAEETRDALRARGITVRDRRSTQQYRRSRS